ncbi:MAG: hypothetical protein JXA60_05665 [Candidatus Coatesbacteria bacterium]|nr:hypothetical protein [Candidatus Coatesbacteria bacterium]
MIIAMLFINCWNPFKPDEEPPDQNTPPADRKDAARCLEYMRQAYSNLDIKKYEECLAEDFKFYLLPDDWFQEAGDTTKYWGRTTEIDLTTCLFESASSITLEFYADPYGHDEEQSNGEVLRVFNKSFDLTLNIDDTGEIYSATGQATFYMRKNKTTELWEIVRWDDNSSTNGCSAKKKNDFFQNTLKIKKDVRFIRKEKQRTRII